LKRETRAGDAEQRFVDVVAAFAKDRQLAPIAKAFHADKARSRPRKFGDGTLRVNGKMFAMLVRERLVVKLPKPRVKDLVGKGHGELFDPGHGRLMKEWGVIVDDTCSWVELAKEAHQFVRGIR
jgi:hypothetical protein